MQESSVKIENLALPPCDAVKHMTGFRPVRGRLDAFLIFRPSVLTASLRAARLYCFAGDRVRKRNAMEAVYLSIVIVFFGLSFGMIWLLDRV